MIFNPEDIKIEIINPHKNGGQHVSFTYSILKVTHIPTGTIVQLSGRSQYKVRTIALEMIEWALSNNI